MSAAFLATKAKPMFLFVFLTRPVTAQVIILTEEAEVIVSFPHEFVENQMGKQPASVIETTYSMSMATTVCAVG